MMTRHGLLLAALGLWLVLLFYPLPDPGPWGRTICDLGHAPTFLLATFAANRILGPRLGRGGAVLTAGLGLACFGILSEPLQGWIGREPSWSDMVANLVGVAGGTLLACAVFLAQRDGEVAEAGLPGRRRERALHGNAA